MSGFVLPARRQLALMSIIADEVALPLLFAELRRRWRLVVSVTLCSIVAVVALMLTREDQFEATVVMSAVKEEAGIGGGSAALLSQFGGLAALGGMSLGGGGKVNESIATLESAVLAEKFIRERDLLTEIFHDNWDAEGKRWKRGPIARVLDRKDPSIWLAEEKFRDQVRTVSVDKKTGLVRLSITWRDPELAASWANELVDRANAYLRNNAIARSNRNLEYLNGQLAKTTVVELQGAIYSLIESEIKKVMIASGNDEYAFKIIDRARVPERPARPSLLLMILAGGILGISGALSFIWVTVFGRQSEANAVAQG